MFIFYVKEPVQKAKTSKAMPYNDYDEEKSFFANANIAKLTRE